MTAADGDRLFGRQAEPGDDGWGWDDTRRALGWEQTDQTRARAKTRNGKADK